MFHKKQNTMNKEPNDIVLQVGVKAFLRNNEGKFLLLKRNPEVYKNTKGGWDIVGGRIEAGSSLFDNLKREVREETGLELRSETKLIYAQDILRVHMKHIVRLTYVATIEGEPLIDAESVDYKWFSIQEMKEEPELDAYVREILDLNLLK